MSKQNREGTPRLSSGLQDRMQDCSLEFVPPPSAPHLNRIAPNRWELSGTDYTLEYCQQKGSFVARYCGEQLFFSETLEEALGLFQSCQKALEGP